MKDKKSIMLVSGVSIILLSLVVIMIWIMSGDTGRAAIEKLPQEDPSDQATDSMEWQNTGPMNMGKFIGQVAYNEEKDLYSLQLRGARFPFKASPMQAKEVKLEAEGKDALEKNTSLLYGILGPDVEYATLLINPDEEDEVMPAITDIARYIQIVNPAKFAGLAYTKSGGKMEKSVAKGSQIQALEKDATSKTPIVQIKGPKSGATETKVEVVDAGKVIVEGKTYEDLYKAADLVGITLLKMLCGSPECPDPNACATGGSCGCG
jgi:hypothetical protein